ncbi:MAG: restriction endonuclease [Lentisphaerae bacterium]|nr:restriction endonuclease [Lentisphaerota bacterium]
MKDKFSKQQFSELLKKFVQSLSSYVSTPDGQWTIKGFIDIYRNIYTISTDTKIVSKVLELHILPQLVQFANSNGFKIELASQQNYYPDLTFVYKKNPQIIFAVDLKTSYRRVADPQMCNGFTLGSHGEYFCDRSSTKYIQYPYAKYSGHFCLGIIYDRIENNNPQIETVSGTLDKLEQITSVIKNFQFFAEEKWKIASDKSGSGNTANIGSIKKIDDIIAGRGVFVPYGEEIFDDYWMNFGKISVTDKNGKTKKLTSLKEYLRYRGIEKK